MKTYTICKVDPTMNQEKVFPILSRNLEDISENGYTWKYISSPYGRAHCWLAKEKDSAKYVGTGALFQRKIHIHGVPLYGAIAGDFAVDKDHRAYGPALKLQREVESHLKNNEIEFIYGLPNKLAKPIFLRIGYVELGNFNRYIKILRTEYKLNKYLFPMSSAKVFSKAIDFSLRIFSKEMRYKTSNDIFVEMPITFDERFDVFWEKAVKTFSIIGERNSQFLDWRYKKSPYKNYEIFTLVNDKREIIAYIVYFIKENMCHIADILFINKGNIIDSLFAEFCNYMRERNIGSISIRFLGCSLLSHTLKNFMFILDKRTTEKVMIYFKNNHPSISGLLNSDIWYFLEGDSDI